MDEASHNTSSAPEYTTNGTKDTEQVQATGDNTTLMGVLAYLGPLVLIPFLVAKEDPFVKFHIKQGIVLLVPEVILWVLDSMIYSRLFWSITDLLGLGLMILSILGIVNVLQKKQVPVPLLGQYADRVKI